MAFAMGGQEGALNGTTPVTVVTAPSSGNRRDVRGISITNKDTAAITVTISKNKASTLRRLYRETLAVDETLVYDKVVVLDATDESVEAVMSGAAATTNPDFDAAFGEVIP
jgi:hypothetical protein